MGLHSRFFRGDAVLEACLVKDQAHILSGSVGTHVAKIQSALGDLDNAQIEELELFAKRYGKSTARAVLNYKTKRNIVNLSYQTKADDIVGKMTIASLDKEIAAKEQRSRRVLSCGDPEGAPGPIAFQRGRLNFKIGAGQTVQPTPSAQQTTFPARLNILWQPTAEAVKRAGNKHLFQVVEANHLLKFFGMEIISNVSSFPDKTIPFHEIIDDRFRSDAFRVRAAAERERPGFLNVLRIIVCPFQGQGVFGFTEGGTQDDRTFQDFILINANKIRSDNMTVLHEMIHAATGLTETDHDTDPDSVFSTSSTRGVLMREHAKALSHAFFALP